jgi:hypothetical protein
MLFELHRNVVTTWPATGRHILASYDETSVVVYQAYRPSIGRFAATNGWFGGDFSLSRMSWIKPNFLWMMYRSGWGTKEGQEVTLAVRIRREAFDRILAGAVPSSHDPELFASREAWRNAVASSNVRVQWDPDHDPIGTPVDRRAVQLGLRGDVLARYAREWIVSIEDISDFVASQRENARDFRERDLRVPLERVYPVTDPKTMRRLGL